MILGTDEELRFSFPFAHLQTFFYHSLLLMCASLNMIQQWSLKFWILCLAGYVWVVESKYRLVCDKGKDRIFLQLYNCLFLSPNSGQHCRWAAFPPIFRKENKTVLVHFHYKSTENFYNNDFWKYCSKW